MKKLIILLLIIGLTGCGVVDDAKDSYDKIAEEAGDVVDGIQETKEKIEETVDDIENAADKISETKDALDEITE